MPTAREALAIAFERLAKTAPEKKIIANYYQQANQMNLLEAHLQTLRERLRQAGDNGMTAEQRAELRQEISEVEQRIIKTDKMLLQFENAKPIKNLVLAETKRSYQAAMEVSKQRIARYRENAQGSIERQKHLKSIDGNAKTMARWAADPNNKQHVPEELRHAVADMLMQLDMAWTQNGQTIDSYRSLDWRGTMRRLMARMQQHDALDNTVHARESLSYMMDIDPDLVSDMQEIVDGNDGVIFLQTQYANI